MTKLSQLKAKIIEANPEIMELKFGCEVWLPETHTDILMGVPTKMVNLEEGKKYVIWSRMNFDIQQGRVELKLVSDKEKEVEELITSTIYEDHESRPYAILGRQIRLADILFAIKKNVEELAPENLNWLLNNYNLTSDSLDDQSEEMISFLHKIICKE